MIICTIIQQIWWVNGWQPSLFKILRLIYYGTILSSNLTAFVNILRAYSIRKIGGGGLAPHFFLALFFSNLRIKKITLYLKVDPLPKFSGKMEEIEVKIRKLTVKLPPTLPRIRIFEKIFFLNMYGYSYESLFSCIFEKGKNWHALK